MFTRTRCALAHYLKLSPPEVVRQGAPEASGETVPAGVRPGRHSKNRTEGMEA